MFATAAVGAPVVNVNDAPFMSAASSAQFAPVSLLVQDVDIVAAGAVQVDEVLLASTGRWRVPVKFSPPRNGDGTGHASTARVMVPGGTP